MDKSRSKVVMTGCGWVTPLCAGSIEAVLSAARSAALPPNPETGFHGVPDQVLDPPASLPDGLSAERDLRIAAIALEIARAQSGLNFESLAADRVGIVLGCAFAGQAGMIAFADEVRQQSPRFVSPIHFPQTVGNYPAGGLGRGYHVRGPNITLSGGAASGLDALVTASQLIAAGDADAVIAGGMETLTQHLASCAAGTFIPAEGACLFLLERADSAASRKCHILAQVVDSDQTSARGWQPPGDGSVLSCAGVPWPGAVAIEKWVGGCGAAAGAASVAAGIGAAWGLKAPVSDTSNANLIDERSFPAAAEVCAFADADGGSRTVLRLRVGPRP